MSVKKTGQNQHYVPEGFLKQFTDSTGHFYQAKIKQRGLAPLKLKPVYPAQVCYYKDYYKLTDHTEKVASARAINPTVEKNFIEEKAFLYENDLKKIIDQFRVRSPFIINREYFNLISAYISLKQRNPYYRDQLSDTQLITTTIDNVIKQLSTDPTTEYLRSNYGFDYEAYTEDFKRRELSDPTHAERIHLGILVSTAQGRINPMGITPDFFLMNAFVIQAGQEDYFLVSDNPGYTTKIQSKTEYGIYNTDLAAFHQVVIPLNSKQALVIEGSKVNRANQNNPIRKINYLTVSSEEVYQTNRSATFVTTSKLFCESEDYLNRFIERATKDSTILN